MLVIISIRSMTFIIMADSKVLEIPSKNMAVLQFLRDWSIFQ